MGVQTAVAAAPGAAQEGQLEGIGAVNVIQTGIVDDANGAVKFGRFVTTKTPGNPPVVELPNATGEVTGVGGLGVVVKETFNLQSDDGVFDGHANGAVVPICKKGVIWVMCEDQISAAPVQAYVRFTANGAGKAIGQFLTTDDSAKAVALQRARLLDNCAAGGLTRLEFNLP